MKLPSSQTYAFWLALARIYAGAFWLMHGIPKFTQSQDFMPPNGMMMGFVNNAVAHTTGPYQNFLTFVVLPNASLFAELVRLGEVITGCLLLLGFFTRGGAILGMLLSLNYLTAKGGFSHLSMWSSLDSLAFAMCLLNAILPTGRYLGVDALLARSRRAPAAPSAVFVDEPPMTGPTAPTA